MWGDYIMTGKKFKFRTDSLGNSAIKEAVSKTKVKDGVKLSVSMGMTTTLNLAPLAIVEQGVITPFQGEIMEGESTPAFYYPITELVYICTLNILVRNNKVVSKDIVVYKPAGIVSKNELYCERITSEFPKNIQMGIADNLLTFAMTRL